MCVVSTRTHTALIPEYHILSIYFSSLIILCTSNFALLPIFLWIRVSVLLRSEKPNFLSIKMSSICFWIYSFFIYFLFTQFPTLGATLLPVFTKLNSNKRVLNNISYRYVNGNYLILRLVNQSSFLQNLFRTYTVVNFHYSYQIFFKFKWKFVSTETHEKSNITLFPILPVLRKSKKVLEY